MLKWMFSDRNEPWRVFFVLGTLSGILFLGIWPLWALLHILDYPGSLHAQGVISLGIGSFAIGFLFTALPRFTGSFPATNLELALALGFSFLEFVFLLEKNIPLGQTLGALKFLLVIIFAMRRFLKNQFGSEIPPSFFWIPLALISAVVGLLVPAENSFLYRGFLTGLYMGIGGKLIPYLTGVARTSPLEIEVRREKDFWKQNSIRILHGLLAVGFFSGMATEIIFREVRLGLTVQALALLISVAGAWKLYRLPEGGWRSRTIWVGSWALVVGYLASAFFPEQKIHFLHIAFIGCFLGSTLAVASHVAVTHQEADQSLLVGFRPLGLISIFVWIAALTRVLALIASYEHHLGYAGLTAVIALMLWGWRFIVKLPKA